MNLNVKIRRRLKDEWDVAGRRDMGKAGILNPPFCRNMLVFLNFL